MRQGRAADTLISGRDFNLKLASLQRIHSGCIITMLISFVSLSILLFLFFRQHSVLSVLDVPASGRVADIGAGTGLFMSGLARAVGSEGHVYEVEPFEKFVDYLTQRRAQMEPELAERITVVQSTEFDIGAIPAGTLDLVIAIDAYHHFEYPTPLLRSIHRALKADGRLAILDFERIPGVSSEWILGHVRANKETVTEEVQACGFKVKENLKEKVKLEENYLLIFTKEETQ